MVVFAAVRLLACAAIDALARPARRWMMASFIAIGIQIQRDEDFATPGVMNLLCRVGDCGRGVSPVVAG